jgi:hypothetical protein
MRKSGDSQQGLLALGTVFCRTARLAAWPGDSGSCLSHEVCMCPHLHFAHTLCFLSVRSAQEWNQYLSTVQLGSAGRASFWPGVLTASSLLSSFLVEQLWLLPLCLCTRKSPLCFFPACQHPLPFPCAGILGSAHSG